MKKIKITTLALGIITTLAFVSCGGKRSTGRDYMPDMGKSRAYESYAWHDTALFITDAAKRGGNMIFYNSTPVPGTLKRGELFPYTMANDSNGYKMSAAVKNPFTDKLNTTDLAEAGRLFNINCAICHGEKAGGNGPLSTSGKVGGVANLTLPNYVSMSDGTMFHSITYGKGVMGSYASQLSRQQRWQVIKYIRTIQNPKGSAAADSTAAKKTGADSSTVAKKM